MDSIVSIYVQWRIQGGYIPPPPHQTFGLPVFRIHSDYYFSFSYYILIMSLIYSVLTIGCCFSTSLGSEIIIRYVFSARSGGTDEVGQVIALTFCLCLYNS